MDALEAVLRDVIPAVHEEDGCELYALQRGTDRLVVLEKWRDADALGAHGSGENIQALGARLTGLVQGQPDVQVLEAIPIGDTDKGAV
jgi:quinol monooxygenase YgiN